MILPKQITIFGNTIDVIEVDCVNEEMGDFWEFVPRKGFKCSVYKNLNN